MTSQRAAARAVGSRARRRSAARSTSATDSGIENVFQDERRSRAAETRSEQDGLMLSAGGWSGVGGGARDGDEDVSLEAYVASQLSLHDFAGEQLRSPRRIRSTG